ncbi:uncharacterized protein LOC114292916 isoform X3 [Camellia sinensis]|uniref:uncharacterized protein LOC114292916 isoform X3 n=1 Tax=Camellia sinensis TaxID=4442 RepID=UPI001036A573|nr:uncharacterized protein LOC114292916 isoform X3 [Camellia sinensis]XP_028092734.1 uncharacterized protein LOC114292916 isoform X3 [Camellia sinensis]
MAKRELSNTLKNLKFMQRAVQREEKSKKEEEVIPDGNFPSSGTLNKCKVIVEGDPHPGAIKGRMSFQSFNPSIDKLNEEARNLCQPEASTTCSGNQNGRTSDRKMFKLIKNHRQMIVEVLTSNQSVKSWIGVF